MPKKPAHIQEKLPFQKSILGRTVLHSIVITTITAIVLSLCSFLVAKSLLESRVLAQLSSLVAAKEELIEQRIQTDIERTALLANREGLRSMTSLEALLRELQSKEVPALGITTFDQTGGRVEVGLPIEQAPENLTATILVPLRGEQGWEGLTVFTPLGNGSLAIRYSLKEFLDSLLTVSSLGETGEVIIAREEKGELILLNHSYAPGKRSPLSLGALHEQLNFLTPIAIAVSGEEGVTQSEDYEGQQVYVAYRSLPRLGWGLVVKVHKSEAIKGITFLAVTFVIISTLLLGLAAYFALLLGRHLTGPLVSLTKRVSTLGPGHWSLKRTIRTGDEVEKLEHVASDMASRLKKVYDHLEEEVQDRTKELKAQFLKDRTILETIDHGVIMVNAKGEITNANPAASELLKCDGEKCLSNKVEEIFDVYRHHKQLKGKRHPVLVCLRKREVVRSSPDVRFSVMRSDHILIPVMMVIKPLVQSRKLIGAVIVFQDVTEERRVDYLKSEFISLASHQLRTPLSTIQWYVELFRDEKKLTAAQKDYVIEMNIATKRMANLLDALLHAARLEGENITPHTHKVDVTKLVKDLSDELRTMAKEKKISCTIDIPSASHVIETDSVLLHVVFKNLFSNAVKYTGTGGRVGVSMKSRKNGVEISVSDSGIGIPSREQKRIFQRLFRAENVRKIDTDGNGLGLFISKMIILSLGGKISFKSIEGKGSVFTVSIPQIAKKSTKKKKK